MACDSLALFVSAIAALIDLGFESMPIIFDLFPESLARYLVKSPGPQPTSTIFWPGPISRKVLYSWCSHGFDSRYRRRIRRLRRKYLTRKARFDTLSFFRLLL